MAQCEEEVTYKGLGSALSSSAYALRLGGRVVGQIDPSARLYQVTAHWYTPNRGEERVLVLGTEEYDAITRAGVEVVEYVAQTTPRVWRAMLRDHRSLRTMLGWRWVVRETACRELPNGGIR